MSRVLHLVRFDALALRVPLALWGAVLMLEGAFFCFGPFESAALPEFGRLSATLGLTIIRMIVSVVMIALLVHADSTVGTTAFWRTRPISRLTLLASKLVSTALWLVLLPGAVTTMVLWWLGLNLADASSGGALTSYEQAVFVFMALALAIVTKDLVQFIVAAAIGIGVSAVLEQTLMNAVYSASPALRNVFAHLPGVSAGPIIITLVALVAIYQYLTLRRRSSIVMLVCGMIVVFVMPRLGGRASTTPSWPPAAPAHLVSPTDVALSIAPETQTVRSAAPSVEDSGVPKSVLSFELTKTGEPEAIYVRLAEVRSTVEFEDHSRVNWSGRWPASALTDAARQATVDDQPYRRIRKVLGNPDLYIPPSTKGPSSRYRVDVGKIAQAQLSSRLGQSARLDASVVLLAYQHDVTATVPLAAGRKAALPNTGAVSIESVSRTSAGITVGVRETLLERYSDTWYWSGSGWRQYALRNANRRLALLGDFTPGGRFGSYTFSFVGTQVRTGVFSLFFRVPDAAAGGPVVDDEWMKGAELVRLDMRLVGTVTRPLRLESFVVGGTRK